VSRGLQTNLQHEHFRGNDASNFSSEVVFYTEHGYVNVSDDLVPSIIGRKIFYPKDLGANIWRNSLPPSSLQKMFFLEH
jgi:hypothetical protein